MFKTLKKGLSVVISAAMIAGGMLVPMTASAAAAEGRTGDVAWSYDAGMLTISGSGAMEDYTSPYKMPWYSYIGDITAVNFEEGVTHIGNYSFINARKITSLTIPASVVNIGDVAFSNCDGLTSVTFAAGSQLETIGKNAFYYIDNDAFTELDLSGTQLKVIGESAFYKTPLQTVKLPSTIEGIGNSAFCNAQLKEINLPEGLKNIGNLAFRGTNLTGVTIPSTAETIGSSAFAFCYDLASITVSGNNLVIDERAFREAGSNASSLTITVKDGVKSIGGGAFTDCKNLTGVTIEDNTCGLEIGDAAFYGAQKATTLKLGSGITSIGASAFRDWESVLGIVVPEGVTSIGEYAFSDCFNLKAVVIPSTVDSVDNVGINLFYGSTKLANCLYKGTDNAVKEELAKQAAETDKETIKVYPEVPAVWEIGAGDGEMLKALLRGDYKWPDGKKYALHTDTIRLTDDVTVDSTLDVYKAVKLDLNGHTLTVTDGDALVNRSNGELQIFTINDSAGGGKVVSQTGTALRNTNIHSMVVNGGTFEGAAYGLYNEQNSPYTKGVELNGGTFKGGRYGIHTDGSFLTFKNAGFTSMEGYATVNIEGDYTGITKLRGVSIKMAEYSSIALDNAVLTDVQFYSGDYSGSVSDGSGIRLSGGTFTEALKNDLVTYNADFTDASYSFVDNGNGTYTVSGAETFTVNFITANEAKGYIDTLSLTWGKVGAADYTGTGSYSEIEHFSTAATLTNVLEGMYIDITPVFKPADGYLFKGWYTDKEGTGDAIATDASGRYIVSGDDAVSVPGKPADDRVINFYAVFEPADSEFAAAAQAWYDAGVLEISSTTEMKYLAYLVNEEGLDFAGKTVTLTADLDYNNETDVYSPIGYVNAYHAMNWGTSTYDAEKAVNHPFNGTFDGNGHTISNVIVTDKYINNGLFGKTGSSAVIKGLTVKDSDFEVAPGGDWFNCGGIVGDALGLVEDCHAEGVKVRGRFCGGIVGHSYGVTIRNVSVNNVSAAVYDGVVGAKGGGVIGYAEGGRIDGAKITNVTAGAALIFHSNVNPGTYTNIVCHAPDLPLINMDQPNEGTITIGGDKTNVFVKTLIESQSFDLVIDGGNYIIVGDEFFNNGYDPETNIIPSNDKYVKGKYYKDKDVSASITIKDGIFWHSDTDAGFYCIDADKETGPYTVYGVMRFIFNTNPFEEGRFYTDKTIEDCGIIYSRADKISDSAYADTFAIDEATMTESTSTSYGLGLDSVFNTVAENTGNGDKHVFRGDIIGIDDDGTYYAKAYVKIDGKTYWSNTVSCKMDETAWNKYIIDYDYTRGGN